MAISFKQLQADYPAQYADDPDRSRKHLYTNILGGGFADLVDHPDYQNTCAIRMSVAFNASPSPVARKYGVADGNHKDKNGNHIIIRVRTLQTFLEDVLGAETWGMSKQPGTPFNFADVPRKTGILMYHANFSDASGHADLWNGKGCVYKCPVPHVAKAFDFRLWAVS
ncbi:type VI secretion system amidase effector protein Tae4 [Alteraurantiacibacter aestuarii]|uniref:Type VI secretion system (T6SS), amidase effector protein 4 n=2 Tax=Alteraurantiacibacter aestuarii TaxID=650004 RepID=A0A844ZHX5_9SPHN|nr:hypothetical protein [Alteraurantiacibacter aestuarii]